MAIRVTLEYLHSDQRNGIDSSLDELSEYLAKFYLEFTADVQDQISISLSVSLPDKMTISNEKW